MMNPELPHNDLFAKRWPRFLARLFDLWWEAIVIALLVAVLRRYSPLLAVWMAKPLGNTVFGLLYMIAALTVDAFVYKIFGNTPGKALLGLKVLTIDSQPLFWFQYLKRNFWVFVWGMGCGIPPLPLVAGWWQFRKLGRGQQTSYDEPTGFWVQSRHSHLFSKIFFCIAFTGLACLFIVSPFVRIAQNINATKERPAYSWENPWTKQSMTIDGKWKSTVKTDDKNNKTVLFSTALDRASLLLLSATLPKDKTLQDFVKSYQKQKIENFSFSNGGRFLEKNGHPAWEYVSQPEDNSTNFMAVQAVQIDFSIWLIITSQKIPHDDTDLAVEQLKTTLWNTIMK